MAFKKPPSISSDSGFAQTRVCKRPLSAKGDNDYDANADTNILKGDNARYGDVFFYSYLSFSLALAASAISRLAYAARSCQPYFLAEGDWLCAVCNVIQSNNVD